MSIATITIRTGEGALPRGRLEITARRGEDLRLEAGTTKLLWYDEVIIRAKQVQQNYYSADTERTLAGARASVDHGALLSVEQGQAERRRGKQHRAHRRGRRA